MGRLDLLLGHPFLGFTTTLGVERRQAVALPGGRAEPYMRDDEVTGDPVTIERRPAHVALHRCDILVSGASEPVQRLDVVLFHTFTVRAARPSAMRWRGQCSSYTSSRVPGVAAPLRTPVSWSCPRRSGRSTRRSTRLHLERDVVDRDGPTVLFRMPATRTTGASFIPTRSYSFQHS